MNAIVEALKADHERYQRYISAFEQEATSLANGDLSDHALIRALAEFFATLPDELHHRTEDVVYLQLATRLSNDLGDQSEHLHAIFDLKNDHLELAAFADTFREGVAEMISGEDLPRRELARLCIEYIRSFRTHMLNEEVHFFPLVVEFLSFEDWREVDRTIQGLKLNHGSEARKETAQQLEHQVSMLLDKRLN
ncbi:MAG: hemerythrin domain-containing protein [Pseudomonadota bacterium]